MAPRKSSKSPARKATRSKSSGLSSVTTKTKEILNQLSPSTRKMSPGVIHVANTMAFLTTALATAIFIFSINLNFGLVGKFILPLVTKIYLQPLRLAGLSSRALSFLGLGWYSVTTFLVMPIINCILISCNGVACDTVNPRRQKDQLTGVTHRFGCAQSNMIEGLVLLMASMFTAIYAGVNEKILIEMITFYLIMRKLYVIAYTFGFGFPRVVCYLAGVISCFYLFYMTVLKYIS